MDIPSVQRVNRRKFQGLFTTRQNHPQTEDSLVI